MARAVDWVEGARLRTLPAAVAPVLTGTAVAFWAEGFDPVRALLALAVAVALQLGVNYANDYSDGVRGTDADRVGPVRLVGSGLASPREVKAAAFACFGVAGLAGLALVWLTTAWWLLAVGVVCIIAAWFYTGGQRPYGYAGWGEVVVFVFFGLVATAGTAYVQLGFVPAGAWWGGVMCGALASAILVANNLRDRVGDEAAGKRTLAVRLGERGTRRLYAGLVALSVLAVLALAWTTSPAALGGLVQLVLLVGPLRAVLTGAQGRELIGVLKRTGLAELLGAFGVTVGLVIA